jgi:acyl carrier protein
MLYIFPTAFKINIPKRRWEQIKSVRKLAKGCGKS